MAESIRFWARERPNEIFVIFKGRDLTWSELDRRSDELAVGLHGVGLRQGSRVSVLLDTCLDYVEVTAAALKLGAIVNPINVRLAAPEIHQQILDAGSRVVISQRSHLDKVERTADGSGHGLLVFSIDGGDVAHLDALRSAGSTPGHVCVEPDDGLYLCYSSGTTGTPKAALLTHDGVRQNALSKHLPSGITFRDRVLAVAPLGITAGLVNTITQLGFVFGTQIILSEYDPTLCLRMIEVHQITVMANAAIFLERMMDDKGFASTDLSSLRHVNTGGAVVSDGLLAGFGAKGVTLAQSFGQTESSGYITAINERDVAKHPRSAGRAVLHGAIRIVDDADNDVPVGEAGEILYSGPGIMREYWNQPAETEQALRGGWLHTGDIGFVDPDGFLTVCDRKKDMIRSGGLNIYPAEVERVLGGVSGLADMAVVGVPHSTWNEVGMVVVGGAPGIVSIDEVRAVCGSQLATFKHPHFLVYFGQPLPRNASGKVRKVELRSFFPGVPGDAIALR